MTQVFWSFLPGVSLPATERRMSNSTAETSVKQDVLHGRFHAVLYGTLDNIFYVFAHSNQEI